MTEQKESRVEAGSEQLKLEHEERTEWRERILIAKAKGISLVVAVSIGMLSLLVCSFRLEDTSAIIHAVTPIITGVLSFFAGRLKR